MSLKLKILGSNQTEISMESGIEVLFSFSTPVAAFIPGRGYVKTATSYSRTTSKHIKSWTNTEDTEPQAFFDTLI